MTDSKKLDLILTEMQGMKTDIQDMKTEMQGMKTDIQDVKADIQVMQSNIQELDRRTAGIGMHLENHTDKNIQLLAENFIELTNKLNQAIPAADKNLAYEVKVNYLLLEVDKLKEKVAMQNDKTA